VADLFQSDWERIKLRRSQQDLDDLIAMLDRDGSIDITDDPSDEEIAAAQQKLAEAAAAAAEEETASQEEADEAAREKAALENVANFQPLVSSQPSEEELAAQEEPAPKSGRGKKQAEEPAPA
jgi:Skp family chaperone for outer membrane proteins